MGNLKKYFREKFAKFLLVLVFTEVWERYSYFTLRAINVLYMTNMMKLDDLRALRTNALVESFSNLLPILTGYLADKFFGFRTMTLAGGIVIALGHFFLTFSFTNDLFYFVGCSAIALGTGFFRGNISNLLGACYDTYSHLDRIGGFTLFYAGVNLGAFVAFLTSGYFAELISYHFTFSIAGIGMLIGLIIFSYHRKLYINLDFSGNPNIIKQKFGPLGWGSLLLIITVILTIPNTFTFYYAKIIGSVNLALWFGILTVIIMLYLIYSIKNLKDRLSVTLLIVYFVYLLIYLAFEGLFTNSVVLIIDRNVYQYWGPLYLPATLVITVNPLLITISGFLLSTFYKHNVKYELPRITFAMIIMIVAYLIAYWGLSMANEETALTNYIYPTLTIFLMAAGEVSINPLMQAVSTVYSPQSKRGLVMGIYLAVRGIGSLVSVTFSYLFDVEEDAQGNFDPKQSLQVYKNAIRTIIYMYLGCFAFFALTFFIVIIIQRKLAKINAQESSKNVTVIKTVNVKTKPVAIFKYTDKSSKLEVSTRE